MTDFNSPDYASSLPAPNLETKRAQRRQVLRQIVLPFTFLVVLTSVIVASLVTSGVGSVQRWSEISAIFLIGLTIIGLFIPLALALGLIYLFAQLLRLLPPYAHQAQQAIERIQSQIRSGADISVQPLLKIQSFLAMMGALFGRNK